MTDRHQFRADWHNYNEGIYFVTICCAEKKHFFGYIRNSRMQLSDIGKIMRTTLDNLTRHIPDVEIWNSVIMPNHIHMVIAVGRAMARPHLPHHLARPKTILKNQV